MGYGGVGWPYPTPGRGRERGLDCPTLTLRGEGVGLGCAILSFFPGKLRCRERGVSLSCAISAAPPPLRPREGGGSCATFPRGEGVGLRYLPPSPRREVEKGWAALPPPPPGSGARGGLDCATSPPPAPFDKIYWLSSQMGTSQNKNWWSLGVPVGVRDGTKNGGGSLVIGRSFGRSVGRSVGRALCFES